MIIYLCIIIDIMIYMCKNKYASELENVFCATHFACPQSRFRVSGYVKILWLTLHVLSQGPSAFWSKKYG